MSASLQSVAASGNVWEVRMTWGDRNLEAEVIDGRRRKQLSLGDLDSDDFVIVAGSRMRFTWMPSGLQVQFSSGVSGTARLGGNEPVSLGELVERGLAQESGALFSIFLKSGDSLHLQVGGPTLEVRQAKGRVALLGADTMALAAMIAGFVLIALWLAATILPMQPLNLIPREMKPSQRR